MEMAIWRMSDEGPVQLGPSQLKLESRLEDMLLAEPAMIGADLLVLGRQVRTEYGGFIDLLAIDSDARVHVLELKRDMTPRDVVAQTLDYGSWVQNLTLQDLERIYAEHHDDGGQFDEDFARRFYVPLPDVVNAEQQFTIVASALDPASDRIVEFLAESYGVPINAVFFRHFSDDGREYLARTWLLDPVEAEAKSARPSRSKLRPWNGRDFYVVLGRVDQQGGERWPLARRYGLLCAGGGSWYWKPLKNLKPGHRVFASVGGAGYVGVGTVTGEMIAARDAVVQIDGRSVPLPEAPGLPTWFAERLLSDDDEVTEKLVPVAWDVTRSIDEAVTTPGIFAQQVTACKLRDERTIEFLQQAFKVGHEP